MWRPKEGWDRPLEMSPLGSTGYRKIDKFSYEAGADAMLEALKKDAIMMICGGHKIGFWPARPRGKNGYLVFIPEGNNDKTG